MSNTGTNETEQSLNAPKSEEELADQILTAVSEGNEDEMERLFSVDVTPDAAEEEDEDSVKDSPSNDEEEEDSNSSEEDAANDGGTTTQEMSPAEERLAKLEQQLADARAAVGRTASLQSRLAQLERQLKQKETSTKKAQEDDADAKLTERINKLKEIDPDTAEILEALRAKQTKQTVQPPEPTELPDDLHEEYYKVLAVHSDADKIFQHPYWHMWKQQLTPDQRAWAESSRSDQVIVAVDEFKKFLQGFGQAPTNTQAAQEDVVDATKEARNKKLQRSADSSDKPVKKAPKFDEAQFFAEAYEKIAKESGITY